MAWTNSKIFRQYIADSINRTSALDANADSYKVALYNDTITPDNDVTAANSAYAVGQWVVANEVSQAVQWPAAGVALTGVVVDVAVADRVMFDAADTASGSAATLTSVFGVLVYDDTIITPVADQGFTYNYLGGTNSVTNGTFTVVWSANGIARFTL